VGRVVVQAVAPVVDRAAVTSKFNRSKQGLSQRAAPVFVQQGSISLRESYLPGLAVTGEQPARISGWPEYVLLGS
jgi:hypothetical protein